MSDNVATNAGSSLGMSLPKGWNVILFWAHKFIMELPGSVCQLSVLFLLLTMMPAVLSSMYCTWSCVLLCKQLGHVSVHGYPCTTGEVPEYTCITDMCQSFHLSLLVGDLVA